MIAAANIEKTSSAQWDTCGTAAAQSPSGVEQAFSETLLAVSNASSESGDANDGSTGGARRKRTEDAQEPGATSDGSAVQSQMNPQQTAPVQQAVPMQQAQVVNPTSSASEMTFAGMLAARDASTAPAGQLTGDQSSSAQLVAGSPQTSAALATGLNPRTNELSEPLSRTQNRVAGAVASEARVRPLVFPSSTASKAAASTAQDSISAAGLNAAPGAVANEARVHPLTFSSATASKVAANPAQDSTPAAGFNATSKRHTNIAVASASHLGLEASAGGVKAVNPQPSSIKSESDSFHTGSALRGAGDLRPNTSNDLLSYLWNGFSSAGADRVQFSSANAGSSATEKLAVRTEADRDSSPKQSGAADPTANTLSNLFLNGVSNSVVSAGSTLSSHIAANTSELNRKAAEVHASIPQAEKDLSQAASKSPEAGDRSTDVPIEALPLSRKNISDSDVKRAAENSTNELLVPASSAAAHAPAKPADADMEAASSSAQSAVAGAAQNSTPTAVQVPLNPVANASAASVLHTAFNQSIKGAAPEAPSGTSTGQAVPPAIAPNQNMFAPSHGLAGGTVSQFAVVNHPGGGLEGTVKASVSSLSSASETKPSSSSSSNGKDTGSDTSGNKQHAQSTSDQTGSQSASTSGDQNQGAVSSQAMNAAPAQLNFANHTAGATIPVQNTAVASLAQDAPAHAGTNGSASQTADSAATAPSIAPQAQSTINTAKLIQSMGQSEMRVGMRSNEFGNISISTSTTRDSVSAQISLDHGELAKELAAHLPEMQSRLGGDQRVNVRIDTSGGMTGQGTGTSGGMSNGSSEQSRGGRQQSSGAASSYASNIVAERQMPTATAAATPGYGRLDARLDIRA